LSPARVPARPLRNGLGALLAAVLVLAGTPAAARTFTARASRVHDGDSLLLVPRGEAPREIRLEGIDCPEHGQPFAEAARDLTAGFVSGRDLEVEGSVADEYGRLLSRVRVDGRDLSLALLRAGLAWHFKRYSSDAELAEAEELARRERRGLWADPAPLAPWDFRARQREAAPRKAAAGAYVGNERSRLFHSAGCKNAGCARCTARFATREAAIAAGYRPAGCCHP
jgi:endonuclease YncB( thermonuclease family)